jgi:hypothetical protein
MRRFILVSSWLHAVQADGLQVLVRLRRYLEEILQLLTGIISTGGAIGKITLLGTATDTTLPTITSVALTNHAAVTHNVNGSDIRRVKFYTPLGSDALHGGFVISLGSQIGSALATIESTSSDQEVHGIFLSFKNDG